ncbi:hypothetical protein [Thalassomonas viridans]|nr:hypothetical protein [Thalassomonas viridans]
MKALIKIMTENVVEQLPGRIGTAQIFLTETGCKSAPVFLSTLAC